MHIYIYIYIYIYIHTRAQVYTSLYGQRSALIGVKTLTTAICIIKATVVVTNTVRYSARYACTHRICRCDWARMTIHHLAVYNNAYRCSGGGSNNDIDAYPPHTTRNVINNRSGYHIEYSESQLLLVVTPIFGPKLILGL